MCCRCHAFNSEMDKGEALSLRRQCSLVALHGSVSILPSRNAILTDFSLTGAQGWWVEMFFSETATLLHVSEIFREAPGKGLSSSHSDCKSSHISSHCKVFASPRVGQSINLERS